MKKEIKDRIICWKDQRRLVLTQKHDPGLCFCRYTLSDRTQWPLKHPTITERKRAEELWVFLCRQTADADPRRVFLLQSKAFLQPQDRPLHSQTVHQLGSSLRRHRMNHTGQAGGVRRAGDAVWSTFGSQSQHPSLVPVACSNTTHTWRGATDPECWRWDTPW